ncbi:MAG: hypothetical protein QOJ66_2475 [Ilumatobacteraceae bacterium]|jgi:signal transduction histidine kinase
MAADRLLRRLGLRLRVTVVAVLTVGIALVVGAVLLVGLLRGRLDTAATTAATLRARDVAALAQAGTIPRTLALPGEESAFVQVVDKAGAVIASTGNIEGEPPISTRKPAALEPLALTIKVAPLDEVDPMRVVALSAATNSGVVTVYAGESLESADNTVSAITTVLAVGLPLLVLIVAGATWWAVGRTLRPVRRISRTMAAITASDLHRRVQVPPTRDEIGQLALTVNETLARLDTSVEQQRRFVADASHELRGPLAALRADLEISVLHPERTTWSEVARDTLSDVERLQHLTEDLLLLARLDSHQERSHRPVDLAAIVTESTRAIQREDLELTLTGVDSPAIVDGDPEQLHRMIRNLMHNAEEHADQHITASVTNGDVMVTLQIADDGPGIPLDQRLTVFERFVRLDTARTRNTGGTGLGLAIVTDVVDSHGGSIIITDSDPHGATFVIELPAHRSTDVTPRRL